MEKLVQFFKALSDKTRLQIIALLLWEKELCVCDIENILELSQSKASRHLRYLLNSGILTDNRKNVWVYYSIDKDLPLAGQRILQLFLQETETREWYDLKIKLNTWLKEKEISSQCSVKKDTE